MPTDAFVADTPPRRLTEWERRVVHVLAPALGDHTMLEPGMAFSVEPGLYDPEHGIGAARKGWLTKADVMNCLPLGKIEAELQAKRKRAAAE